MGNFIDLTGQKFGRLTVIKRDFSKKRTAWLCKCECGKEKVVISNDLRSGKTKSCGCLQKERVINGRKKYLEKNKNIIKPYKDLTGKKFNLLTVIEVDEEKTKQSDRTIWKCRCDCGNLTSVSVSSLINGRVKSCGCLISYGERKIRQLLIDNNFSFETQKKFDDCIFPNGKKALFDFFVENKYLIEYDGEQHYLEKSSLRGYFTQEKIDKIHLYDKIKNEWCKEHNIPLIRIPYWKIDEITIKDLKLGI